MVMSTDCSSRVSIPSNRTVTYNHLKWDPMLSSVFLDLPDKAIRYGYERYSTQFRM